MWKINEFKVEAVKKMIEHGYSITEAAYPLKSYLNTKIFYLEKYFHAFPQAYIQNKHHFLPNHNRPHSTSIAFSVNLRNPLPGVRVISPK